MVFAQIETKTYNLIFHCFCSFCSSVRLCFSLFCSSFSVQLFQRRRLTLRKVQQTFIIMMRYKNYNIFRSKQSLNKKLRIRIDFSEFLQQISSDQKQIGIMCFTHCMLKRDFIFEAFLNMSFI
jgi:hypothetical protein